jgi:hypothetical protein
MELINNTQSTNFENYPVINDIHLYLCLPQIYFEFNNNEHFFDGKIYHLTYLMYKRVSGVHDTYQLKYLIYGSHDRFAIAKCKYLTYTNTKYKHDFQHNVHYTMGEINLINDHYSFNKTYNNRAYSMICWEWKYSNIMGVCASIDGDVLRVEYYKEDKIIIKNMVDAMKHKKEYYPKSLFDMLIY